MAGFFDKPIANRPHSTLERLLDQEVHTTPSASLGRENDESKFSFHNVDPQQHANTVKGYGLEAWTEIKKQCYVAGPMIYVNLLQFSLQVIPLMFVGHLGELALSSACVATTFAEATGSCFLLGMGGALETLCGQSYGARQYQLLGLFMQRAEIVLNLTSVPLAFTWAYMGKILLACGQDPPISINAQKYARWLIPTLFGYASSQPLIKFLQTQSIMIPLVICSSTVVCVHFPLSWVLVYKSGLGYKGAALATSISNWIYVVLLAICVKFSKKCEKARCRFSWEVFHDMNTFFNLAVPSAVMVCLEIWCFDALIFLSGLLDNPQLETSTLTIWSDIFCLLLNVEYISYSISTSTLLYMVPFGLSAAASTRISNELGAGHPQAARMSVCVALNLALVNALIMSTVFYSVRDVWGKLYSNEEEIIHYVAIMMPLVAVQLFLDSIQCILTGISRGCGWQKFGAYVNLGAYYVVGLPVAVLLGFKFHLNGKGLWMGILCGLLAQTLLLFLITALTNWEDQAKKAESRVSSSLTTILPLDIANAEKERLQQ